MSLRMIYGKSGTGKSQYIFEEVAKKIEENHNKKLYNYKP